MAGKITRIKCLKQPKKENVLLNQVDKRIQQVADETTD